MEADASGSEAEFNTMTVRWPALLVFSFVHKNIAIADATQGDNPRCNLGSPRCNLDRDATNPKFLYSSSSSLSNVTWVALALISTSLKCAPYIELSFFFTAVPNLSSSSGTWQAAAG